ncbi:MAG TPA: glycogen synthase [Pyrinomonadaceae bacterium]|nr:glycogen synthase [Pyrinomonadaceae bacterium]
MSAGDQSSKTEDQSAGQPLRVAILSSEAVPFAKTGGLADVSGALTKALHAEGADSFLIIPLYDQIDRTALGGPFIDDLEVDWRGKLARIRVWQSDALKAPTYLIDAPHYFARGKIYGEVNDFERFAFFCRASIALLSRLGAAPDILHCNDWPTGFAAVEMRARRGHEEFFANTRIVFSIHNLAYQGAFRPSDLWWLGFNDYASDFMLQGAASALKAGIVAADVLSTVSPRYAREIQTPEQGYGLDWLMRARSDRLVGIVNGVDYDVWNPETDTDIAAKFSADDLSGKRECKLDLLRRFGLPHEPERPIIGIISRLVSQKGYDLIRKAARGILDTGAFFIALGAGAREYEDFLQSWHDHAPQLVGIFKGYAGEPLAHQIEAGADMFLMPSLYEPCGLNQMYSMRYGTVPVVRATGGLDDTVESFDVSTGKGNGFKFGPYSASALLEKIREAIYFYTQPDIWAKIQRNGMETDNSWSAAAKKYLQLYREVTEDASV